jgi:hypothetical protein
MILLHTDHATFQQVFEIIAPQWITQMAALRSIYDTCKRRPDVEEGTTKDEQFAADLAQVVNQTAPKEYAEPPIFFQHNYPTRGMRELLKAVQPASLQ